MKKILLYIVGGLAALIVGIQFVPVERTNPPVQTRITAPPEVMKILERSCYDCHSNETAWPWYSRVAPVAWWVADDVSKGRDHMNFSTWNAYDEQEQAHKIEEIVEEVEEGKMPLPKDLRLHPQARVYPEELAILKEWARAAGAEEESGSREEESSPTGTGQR